VSLRILPALVLAASALAGCGGEAAGRDAGTASLWVTRDRGAVVLRTARVPAGVTGMEATRREADVGTRYGGRFVQSIDGVEGSLTRRRDWFYFVNGIEADVSAAEYRLRHGDVLWWDYRSWGDSYRVPVVVGAFPEPFLHGWEGRTRPAAVRYSGAGLERAARAIGRLLRARSVAPLPAAAPSSWNLFVLRAGTPRRFQASFRTAGAAPGDAVRFELVSPRAAEDGLRLARKPSLVHRRYEGLP
jgi:hypothetical protein